MRRGFLWAFIITMGIGIPYLYYTGFFDEISLYFPSHSDSTSQVVADPPKLSERDVDSLLSILKDFPKNELYIKSFEIKSGDLKDPFFPEEWLPSSHKIEVEVSPSRGVVMEVPPPIKLEGIIHTGSKKLAVLSIGNEKGLILAQGETWKDIKIIKVEERGVVLSWKSQIKFLYIVEEGSK